MGNLKVSVPKGDQEENLMPEKKDNEENQEKQEKVVERFNKDGVEIYLSSGKRTGHGILMMLIGFVTSFISFLFTYWVSSNFDLSYYWLSIIAVIFSFMVIQAYNKATGDIPSLLRTPVLYFTIIIFVLSLLIGHHHSQGKSAGYLDNILLVADVHKDKRSSAGISDNTSSYNYKKQFGIIRNQDEVWVVSGLPESTVVTVKIRGAAVIVKGEKLLPSDYALESNSDGTLEFKGTKKITTSIEVIP